MDGIDPVEFGRLIQLVENLGDRMTALETSVSSLVTQNATDAGVKKGLLHGLRFGAVLGIVAASSGLGAVAVKVIERYL